MAEIKSIFTPDITTDKEHIITPSEPITDYSNLLSVEGASERALENGKEFTREILDNVLANFEKMGQDTMAHVSTFAYINGLIFMSYYASTQASEEDPSTQTARLVYCPADNPQDQTILDIQSAGDMCCGQKVECVYDTIFAKKDDNTIYVMWTAQVGGIYYRLYRPFYISTKTLGDVQVNRFKVGDVVNDFSASGIQQAMAANDVAYKKMYADIGIMQKFTTRVENGETYYYTGTYSGDWTAIIKSKDFVTWEYVAQPDFMNESMWENATYVIGDKCYYFVRQDFNTSKHGFLTCYDLVNGTWEKPVLVEDSQSRSDFIEYKDGLYLAYAPVNRKHIGILKINKDDISKSEILLIADLHSSCFYPFLQYDENGEIAMSYTVNRKHIRLSKFTLSKYLEEKAEEKKED